MPNLPPMCNLPPPPEPTKLTTAPHKPTLAPSGINSEDPMLELDISKDEALKNTLDNLNCIISRLDSSKAQDIQKRLEKMELMWKEDKLNSIIHKNLFEISSGKEQILILNLFNKFFFFSYFFHGIFSFKE